MGPIKGRAVILGRRAQGRSCAGITEGLAWPLHGAGEAEGIDLTGGAAVSATSEASDAGSARAAWVGRVAGAGPGDAGAGSAGASVGRRERSGACWAGSGAGPTWKEREEKELGSCWVSCWARSRFAGWAGHGFGVCWVFFFSISIYSLFPILIQTKFEFKYKFEFNHTQIIESMHQHECNIKI